MSVKENQEMMRWWYEEMSSFKGNVAGLPSMLQKWMDPKGVYHAPTGDVNYEQYKQTMTALLTAFPDLTLTVEDIIAAGDKVVTRYTVRGTHKGMFMGIAATGKRITISAASIARFAGGKAVEGWGFQDTFGLMQQLGVIPARK